MKKSRQNKTREEECSTSESDGTAQSDENECNINECLPPEIFRKIFEYWDARELAKAAIICRSWLKHAEREKLARGPFCGLEIFHSGSDFLRDFPKPKRIKPSIGFFFVYLAEAHKNICNIEECMKALSSLHCDAIMLLSIGPIMNIKNPENKDVSEIAYIFLPQIPKVEIKFFQLPELSDDSFTSDAIQNTAEYKEIIDAINKTSTLKQSNHKMSTCLMLFSSCGRITAEHCASVIQNSKDNEIDAVWGGKAMYEIYSVKHTHNLSGEFECTTCPCVAVLITGPIQMRSLVLEEDSRTSEVVEERLKYFKDQVELKRHSIGFIIRGNRRKPANNIELTIFKRLFPTVPIVGCYGVVEFGKNTVVDEMDKENQRINERNSTQSWQNKNSTVFFILTYGGLEERKEDEEKKTSKKGKERQKKKIKKKGHGKKTKKGKKKKTKKRG